MVRGECGDWLRQYTVLGDSNIKDTRLEAGIKARRVIRIVYYHVSR
jgi:hypothetical protein